MRSIQPKKPQAAAPQPPEDALSIAQGAGINFDHLQALVDELEQNLVNDDKASNSEPAS